ncbi:hypothetical protein ACTXG6_16020 [Pseudonocardia sp. Cha107L01]|uniref:hypothetical protein n=1 Tax=Pseudonocardia sp. Cha107L01 TaxID=3457576 RepID=UPI00403EF034
MTEIGASIVVIWELSGTGEDRQRKAMRLIGWAFVALALYLLAQSSWVLVAGFHARHSPAGIAWTGVTAVVMFVLAYGKARTGTALDNPVLTTEGRVTLIDGLLAVAVLLGLVLRLDMVSKLCVSLRDLRTPIVDRLRSWRGRSSSGWSRIGSGS